jgi:RimJ/RimL family protein N-acetyltransferase
MPLAVRSATIADSKSVYDWRNDPVTVSTSRTQAGVEWDGHSAWFPKQLASPETTCLIVERSGEPCGVVWFRKNRSAVYETSINLAPQFRGQGLGTPTLAAAMDWMRREKFAFVFSAEIRNDNLPSIGAFERCGFVFVYPSPGFGTYCTSLPARIADQSTAGIRG